MKPDFWLQRWEMGQTAFHQAEVHPALPAHWPDLRVPKRGTVFVPLCGKSNDMLWLRAQGHPVLGVELSSLAVQAFFAENGLRPTILPDGPLERYTAEGVTILCGDLFDLQARHLEDVAAVYDRAALIALPPEMRERYAARMGERLRAGTQMLLVTVEYPKSEMEGPPFSVDEREVRRLYGDQFEIEHLASTDALAQNPHVRARGVTRLTEGTYHLTRRDAK